MMATVSRHWIGTARFAELPPLPSLRALTRELRELHEAWSHPIAGGEYVALTYDVGEGWRARVIGERYVIAAGREWIPGDGAPFDAVRAARRLLAAANDWIANPPEPYQ